MSLPALAPVSALEERLGVPVGSLAGEDLTRAERNLEDASNLVRSETGIAWLTAPDTPTAPDSIVVVVLQAAKRVFLNPDGLTSESVEGYAWQTDQQSMGAYLTEDELRTVKAATREWTQLQSPTRWSGTGSITMRPAWSPALKPREWYM